MTSSLSLRVGAVNCLSQMPPTIVFTKRIKQRMTVNFVAEVDEMELVIGRRIVMARMLYCTPMNRLNGTGAPCQ